MAPPGPHVAKPLCVCMCVFVCLSVHLCVLGSPNQHRSAGNAFLCICVIMYAYVCFWVFMGRSVRLSKRSYTFIVRLILAELQVDNVCTVLIHSHHMLKTIA